MEIRSCHYKKSGGLPPVCPECEGGRISIDVLTLPHLLIPTVHLIVRLRCDKCKYEWREEYAVS